MYAEKETLCVCETPLIPEIKNLLNIHIILYYITLYYILLGLVPCFYLILLKCDFFIVIYLFVLFNI